MNQKVSNASKQSKVSQTYIKVSSYDDKKAYYARSTLQSREDIDIKIPELNLTGIDENFINASLKANFLLKEKCSRCKALNVFLCEHRTPVRDGIREKYSYPAPISYRENTVRKNESAEGNQENTSEDLVKNRLRKIEKHIMEIRLWRKAEFKLKQKKGLITYPVHEKTKPRRRSLFKKRSRVLISRQTKSNNDIYDKKQLEDADESELKENKKIQTPRNKENKETVKGNQPIVSHKRTPIAFSKLVVGEGDHVKNTNNLEQSEENKTNETKNKVQVTKSEKKGICTIL
jgi:hypothetical protein